MIRYQLPEGMMGFVCLSSQLQYKPSSLAFLPSPAACAAQLRYDTDRPRGSEIFPADFQIFDPSGKEKRKLCPIATSFTTL